MSASNNAAAIAAANNPKRNHRTGDNSAVRSLSANLKYPYKRTISAPAGNYYCVVVADDVNDLAILSFFNSIVVAIHLVRCFSVGSVVVVAAAVKFILLDCCCWTIDY